MFCKVETLFLHDKSDRNNSYLRIMTIETKLDFKSYLRLMYTLTYRKPLMIFLTVCGLMMFVFSVFYFFGSKVLFIEPPYFQFVFGLFIIAFLPFSIYRSAKRNFSSNGRLQEKIIYEFTDEKIKMTGETFNTEMNWEKTYKILELKNWILIYQNRQIANVLPKNSFGENLIEFKTLVKRNHIRSKLK